MYKTEWELMRMKENRMEGRKERTGESKARTVMENTSKRRGGARRVGVGALGHLGRLWSADFILARRSLELLSPGEARTLMPQPCKNSLWCLHFAKVEWNGILFFFFPVVPQGSIFHSGVILSPLDSRISVCLICTTLHVKGNCSRWCSDGGSLSRRQSSQLNIEWPFEKCNLGSSECLKRPAHHCQGQRISFFLDYMRVQGPIWNWSRSSVTFP